MHTYSDDLKSADPQAVLDKLLQKSTVLAKKVALHQVKSVLEPNEELEDTFESKRLFTQMTIATNFFLSKISFK